MTFLRGLLAARGHLAFLAGLTAAFLTVRGVQRWSGPRAAGPPVASADLARELPLRPAAAALSPRERALARTAWAYFERNTDRTTGLTASVKGYPAATLWDLGSELQAVLAAEDLGLVSRRDAAELLGRALESLSRLPLCEGLPNKVYDVHTLAPVGYDGRPAPRCLGWSALDVARALAPLSLLAWRHPGLAGAARAAVSRWDLAAVSDGASLRGASREADGTLRRHQEGRLGYEQLAAKDLLAWGVPVAPLLAPAAHATWTEVDGVPVPQDDRRPADHGGARAPVLSEPWILDALENGFDPVTLPAARAVLAVQARRFAATGRLTAVSEDALDRPPWFSYSAVLDDRETWTARAPDGTPAPAALTFSTKAALGWGVLFEGAYADRLVAAAAELAVPGEGLLAGRYDATGEVNRTLSLNTNAVALEALAYRVRGPARAPRHPPAPEARR